MPYCHKIVKLQVMKLGDKEMDSGFPISVFIIYFQISKGAESCRVHRTL